MVSVECSKIHRCLWISHVLPRENFPIRGEKLSSIGLGLASQAIQRGRQERVKAEQKAKGKQERSAGPGWIWAGESCKDAGLTCKKWVILMMYMIEMYFSHTIPPNLTLLWVGGWLSGEGMLGVWD